MTPVFLQGVQGPLFAVFHPPHPASSRRGHVVFAPPFGEELNRSRHLVAHQARLLARAGFGVLIPDLTGTGDSAGEFGDADWATWRSDLAVAGDWLRQNGADRLILWGLRTGALLALDCAETLNAAAIWMWQPVTSGEQFLTQFLRIRVAADVTGKTGAGTAGGESTDMLKQRLAQGEALEIAGYQLNPVLAGTLGQMKLAAIGGGYAGPVDILEVSLADPPKLSPATQRAIDAGRADGRRIGGQAVAGPPFWTQQEPEWAPELVAATLGLAKDT